jgi:hypothetical protein
LRLNESLKLEGDLENGWKLLYEALKSGEEMIQKLSRRCQTSPLLPALLEFHLPQILQHQLAHRGSKNDSWGSFFLLAVTEYMKKELGRPYYRLADELLRAYRTLAASPVSPQKRSGGKARTIDRVKKLKIAHPNWEKVLSPILLQLQLNRNGTKKHRASTREAFEIWNSTRPLTQLVFGHLHARGIMPMHPTTIGKDSRLEIHAHEPKG